MQHCISCAREIEANALKCNYCRDSQSRWKNNIPLLVAFVSILMFLISMGSIVLGISTDIWHDMFWRDKVDIVSYTSGRSVVRNTGTGPIFIEQVVERLIESNRTSIRNIYVSVAPKSFGVFGESLNRAGDFVTPQNAHQFDDALDNGKAYFYFFSKNHSQLKSVKNDGAMTLESECIIGYYTSIDHNRIDREFPCEAVGVVDQRNPN